MKGQVGAKISSLHFAKPYAQGGRAGAGAGAGSGYTLRKRKLFLIFSEVVLSLEVFCWSYECHGSPILNSHFLIIGFYINIDIAQKFILELQMAELPPVLAQRDSGETLVLIHGRKENRAGAEGPWVNPCPTVSSLSDRVRVTSQPPLLRL